MYQRDAGARLRLWGALSLVWTLTGCFLFEGCTNADSETHWAEGETHWLGACKESSDCEAPYDCYCGVCTLGCIESDDCVATEPNSTCIGVATLSCEESLPTATEGFCMLECLSTSDCRDWGAHLSCQYGVCLGPPAVPYSETAPDTGNGDDGDCELSADCDDVIEICAGDPPTCRDRDEGDPCLIDAHCPTALHCSNDHCAPDGFEYIPAGSFWMGAPDGCPAPDGYPGNCAPQPGWWGDDEIPLHEVTLTNPFFMAAVPLTQLGWLDLVGTRFDGWRECDDCPVVMISWWYAAALANALSASQDLPECYTISGCPDSFVDEDCTEISVNAPEGNPYLCSGYRLPTEAEWEYAYRAGTNTNFFIGNIDNDEAIGGCGFDEQLDEVAWWCGNSSGALQPVGQKQPNSWGLYDMAGSTDNWVWDYYDPYPAHSQTDPLGPETGTDRAKRGCAFHSPAVHCRAAHRSDYRLFGEGGVRFVRTAFDAL